MTFITTLLQHTDQNSPSPQVSISAVSCHCHQLLTQLTAIYYKQREKCQQLLCSPVSSINAIEGPQQLPDCKLHHLKGKKPAQFKYYTLKLLFPVILFMLQSPQQLYRHKLWEEKELQNSVPQISHEVSSSNSFLLTQGYSHTFRCGSQPCCKLESN